MKLVYISSNVMNVQKKLLNAIRNKGISVELISFSMRKNSYKYDIDEKIKHYESKSHFRGPLLYKTRLNEIYERLKNDESIKKADILHANMMSADGYLCRRLSAEYSIPYVVSVRNTDINLWFLWKIPSIKKMCYLNLLYAKAIICLSRPYLDKLLSKFPKKIANILKKKCFVIPNGIDDFWINNQNSKNGAEQNLINLITVGRIEKNKNQLIVAKAIKKFSKTSNYIFKYTIIGSVKNKRMLKRLMKYDFVVIKNHMKKEELIYEYRNSDIFILASHKETFGLVYAEALSQGLPIIYTKRQGFDQQFAEGEVGLSVESNKVKSIMKAIEKVILNYALFAKNTNQCCDSFEWASIADKIKYIYDERNDGVL